MALFRAELGTLAWDTVLDREIDIGRPRKCQKRATKSSPLFFFDIFSASLTISLSKCFAETSAGFSTLECDGRRHTFGNGAKKKNRDLKKKSKKEERHTLFGHECQPFRRPI